MDESFKWIIFGYLEVLMFLISIALALSIKTPKFPRKFERNFDIVNEKGLLCFKMH